MADVAAAQQDDNGETEEQRRIRLRQEEMERLLLQDEEETNNNNDPGMTNAANDGNDENDPLLRNNGDENNNNNMNGNLNALNNAMMMNDADDNDMMMNGPAAGAAAGMTHNNNNSMSSLRPKISYTNSSFLAAAATIVYALRSRDGQWYLALVYLSSSKWAFCVLGNALVALAVQVFSVVTTLFLPGGLRLHEAEGLQDFFRWNVTETCLALTMFRSELTVGTACEFLALILVKCLHHVAVMRQNHLRMTDDAVVPSGWSESVPAIPWNHLRVLLFLVLLQLLDMWALQYTAQILMTTGPSVSILFAFEAAILLVSAWSHLLLWNLHVLDGLLHFAHDLGYEWGRRWLHLWKEHKATLNFAVELQAQAVQFMFYLCFFGFVLTYYGMPINLFREVYVSFSALKERLLAFFKYRRLMAGMNRFQTPSDEEIEEAGRTCIICRDEMTVHDCKQLPGCGHMFHKSCLREWLTQQQSCPTCRADIYSNQAQQDNRQVAAQAAAARVEQDNNEEEENNENGANAETTTTGAAPMTPGHAHDGATETPRQSPVGSDAATGAASPKAAIPDKSVRFAEQAAPPSPPFPALYRVVCARGATVWHFDDSVDSNENQTNNTSAETAAAAATATTMPFVMRIVPLSVVVLGEKEQELVLPNGRRRLFVRVPDGWVAEDEILRVFSLGS